MYKEHQKEGTRRRRSSRELRQAVPMAVAVVPPKLPVAQQDHEGDTFQSDRQKITAFFDVLRQYFEKRITMQRFWGPFGKRNRDRARARINSVTDLLTVLSLYQGQLAVFARPQDTHRFRGIFPSWPRYLRKFDKIMSESSLNRDDISANVSGPLDSLITDLNEKKAVMVQPHFNDWNRYFTKLVTLSRFSGLLGRSNGRKANARLASALILLQRVGGHEGSLNGFRHEQNMDQFSGISHRWRNMLNRFNTEVGGLSATKEDIAGPLNELVVHVKRQKAKMVRPFLNECKSYFRHINQARRFTIVTCFNPRKKACDNWKKASHRLESCDAVITHLLDTLGDNTCAAVDYNTFTGLSKRWKGKLETFQQRISSGEFTEETRPYLEEMKIFITGQKELHASFNPNGSSHNAGRSHDFGHTS